MKVDELEKAVARLAIPEIKIILITLSEGNVYAAYAKKGDCTIFPWDRFGRGFRYDIPDANLLEVDDLDYSVLVMLDYRRDESIDLKIE